MINNIIDDKLSDQNKVVVLFISDLICNLKRHDILQEVKPSLEMLQKYKFN